MAVSAANKVPEFINDRFYAYLVNTFLLTCSV